MINPLICSFFTSSFAGIFPERIRQSLQSLPTAENRLRISPAARSNDRQAWMEDHSPGATPSPAATFPISQLVTCPPFTVRDVLSEEVIVGFTAMIGMTITRATPRGCLSVPEEYVARKGEEFGKDSRSRTPRLQGDSHPTDLFHLEVIQLHNALGRRVGLRRTALRGGDR